MQKSSSPPSRAFTLVELLVSTVIISLIMLVLLSMTNQTSQTWRYTTEKIEKFQSARDGFEAMTRRLSQATLNTYWDYVDRNGRVRTQYLESNLNDNAALSRFIATSYGRMSELRFTSGPMSYPASPITPSAGARPLEKLLKVNDVPDYLKYPTHGVFFQAPLGEVTDNADNRTTYGSGYAAMDNVLNTWGFFVETGDYDERPNFITEAIAPKRWRSRLMELRVPSEKMGLYDSQSKDKTTAWFHTWLKIPNGTTGPGARPVRVLAENVTALIIWPKLSKQDEDARLGTASSNAQPVLCPNYHYNSNPDGVDPTSNPPRPWNRNPGVAWNSITIDDVAEKGGVNPLNQLPPVVQVTMVAIDERSAKRLGELNSTGSNKYSLGFDISNLFLKACSSNRWSGGQYEAVSQYETDLATYEQMLINARVTYRIFSTNVSIRGAKWSRSQL